MNKIYQKQRNRDHRVDPALCAHYAKLGFLLSLQDLSYSLEKIEKSSNLCNTSSRDARFSGCKVAVFRGGLSFRIAILKLKSCSTNSKKLSNGSFHLMNFVISQDFFSTILKTTKPLQHFIQGCQIVRLYSGRVSRWPLFSISYFDTEIMFYYLKNC